LLAQWAAYRWVFRAPTGCFLALLAAEAAVRCISAALKCDVRTQKPKKKELNARRPSPALRPSSTPPLIVRVIINNQSLNLWG
jgi:hypothetical protein